ncbi:hypothetical protein FDECE_12895 [Fusarium decemcellulare]|nr:hypothetical protein FDECE_12895 [Fusarium decemcellulare]
MDFEIRDEVGVSDNGVQPVHQYSARQEIRNGNENNTKQPDQQPQDHSNDTQSVQMHKDMVHFLRTYDEGHATQRSSLIRILEQYLPQSARDGVSNLFGKQLTDKAGKLKGKLQVTIREKQALEAHNQQLTTEIAVLKQKLQEANEKTARALDERDEQQRLADGTIFAESAKTTDDAIRSQWQQLDYNIRYLANLLSQFSPNRKPEETAMKRFRTLTPDWHKLILDRDFTELLIKGYIWTFVTEQVFGTENCIWGSGNAAYLKRMRKNIISVEEIIHAENQKRPVPSRKQAAKWLAQGSTLLERIWGPNEAAIRTLATTETKRLQSLINVSRGKQEREEMRIWEEVKRVIDTAVELDLMLESSKALFFTSWGSGLSKHPRGILFRSVSMDALASRRTPSPKSRVEFFVSPYLYKMGNADGQNYDCDMILCKASVQRRTLDVTPRFKKVVWGESGWKVEEVAFLGHNGRLFSAFGDSGSVVFDAEGGVMGLVFTGQKPQNADKTYSYVTAIENVFDDIMASSNGEITAVRIAKS